MPIKTIIEILESARQAVLENRDEVSVIVKDDELANHLKASRYIFEAAEHVDRNKLLRLGTIDCAIERARYDELAESLKADGINTEGMSPEVVARIVAAKKAAKP
jgi:hypothetical protein